VAEQPVVVESPIEPSGDQQTDHVPDAPAEPAAPRKSRRRSPRSAKSPAFSVDPAAEPVSVPPVEVEPAFEGRSFEPSSGQDSGNGAGPTPVAEATPVDQMPEAAAPAARGRRKRPRVVAPAGPPPGAGQPEPAGSEFGS
jgi:ribonuclease E